MFNIMICNITKIRIRLSICTSSEVVLSSICSLRNGSSKEYAWLAYDWMNRMSCFAVRVMGLIYDWNSPLMFINPIGPRILLKHALLFPGFLTNFERFYLFVLKNS